MFNLRKILRIGALVGTAALTLLSAGCDWYAQKNLVVGQDTEADVRKLMGKPEMVWEEESGAKRMEFPRGPNANQTYFVYIDRNGKYQGMEQAISEANFRKVQPGMSRDDVRRTLGRPTEDIYYKLANEDVWSWTYDGPAGTKMSFNVHFPRGNERAARVSRTQDVRHSNS